MKIVLLCLKLDKNQDLNSFNLELNQKCLTCIKSLKKVKWVSSYYKNGIYLKMVLIMTRT